MSLYVDSSVGPRPTPGTVETGPGHGRTAASEQGQYALDERAFQRFLTLGACVVGGPVAGAAVAGATGTPGAGAPGSNLTDMERIQAEGFQNSMQLLALQQQMQDENRQFTSLTNVLRAKHDTAKAALSNVRS